MNCEFVNRKGECCQKVAHKVGIFGKWNGKRLCNTHFNSTRKKSTPVDTNVTTSPPPTPYNTPDLGPKEEVEEPKEEVKEEPKEEVKEEPKEEVKEVPLDIDPRVQELFKIPKHDQRSQEWYQLRRERLTASDVATAIGMNPYSSRADLIYKKCGGKDDFKGNAATKHGEKWEDTAIRIYCEKYNDKAFDFGLLPHPTIPFLGGSPDGITAKGTVLEVKCPLMREIIPGVVPSYYLPQVQIVMECTNLDVAHFIQYKPAPNEVFDVTVVPRDRNWFARYFPVMDFFWREVTHYREIGLEYNPVHIKKLQAEKDKENKKKAVPKLDTSKYLFQDEE